MASDAGATAEPRRLLIVTIESEPRIRLIDWPSTRVEIDHVVFEETGAGDTNGFYDFLRSAKRGIVGVRFIPWDCDYLVDTAAGPRLHVTGAPLFALEMFWTADTRFDQKSSDDQRLMWSYLFRAASGTNAVTFDFSGLPLNEQNELTARFAAPESRP